MSKYVCDCDAGYDSMAELDACQTSNHYRTDSDNNKLISDLNINNKRLTEENELLKYRLIDLGSHIPALPNPLAPRRQITFSDYGECMDTICPFRKECAQHYTAGDFRSEEGFAPEIIGTECLTAMKSIVEDIHNDVCPENYELLGWGFSSKYKPK